MHASSAHTVTSTCKPYLNIKTSTIRVEVISSYVSNTLKKLLENNFHVISINKQTNKNRNKKNPNKNKTKKNQNKKNSLTANTRNNGICEVLRQKKKKIYIQCNYP